MGSERKQRKEGREEVVKLSLAITTFNRPEMTLKSFKDVYDNPSIDEIVIVDDHSDIQNIGKLMDGITELSKVKLFRNEKNVGMQINKAKAVAFCSNPWIILFDSDNQLNNSYIEAIEAVGELSENTLYLPVGAIPNFIYEKYSGLTIDKTNIGQYMNDPMFRCSLNTCNYVVNRDYYVRIFKEDVTVGAADTISHLYNHLIAGGNLYFVPNMRYEHRVHDQSGFMENIEYNLAKAREVENKIMQL